MDYGIELMLEIADMDMYYGLGNNLNRIIRIEDMVNTRFDNDYFDLLSAMLIYHQIVEELMKSLIAIGNFNTRLNLFPQKMPIKIKFDREFYKLVKELEEGVEFENKEEFISLIKKFNRNRNIVAHKIIRDENFETEYLKELENTKDEYEKIQHIYASVALNFFNYVNKNLNKISRYIDYSKNYHEDLKQLESKEIEDRYSIEAVNSVKKAVRMYLNSRVEERKCLEVQNKYSYLF